MVKTTKIIKDMEFRTFYIVINTQTGADIDIFDSIEDAEKKLLELENEDIKNNNYCPDMYEIIDEWLDS
jgi:hypothetical protein